MEPTTRRHQSGSNVVLAAAGSAGSMTSTVIAMPYIESESRRHLVLPAVSLIQGFLDVTPPLLVETGGWSRHITRACSPTLVLRTPRLVGSMHIGYRKCESRYGSQIQFDFCQDVYQSWRRLFLVSSMRRISSGVIVTHVLVPLIILISIPTIYDYERLVRLSLSWFEYRGSCSC